MSIQKFVIDSVAASAADLTTPGGGLVLVTGDTQGFLRKKVQSIDLQYFNPEVLENVRILGTPAANTDYEFSIEQEVDGEIVKSFVAVTTTTAPSAAALATSITAAVQSYIDSGQLKAAAATATSGGDGGVDIVALTGYPRLRIIQENNVTETSLLFSETTPSTAGSVSSGVLTITVADSSDYAVGELIKYSGWAGSGVINGKSSSEGVILRVASLASGTTITAAVETFTGTLSSGTQSVQLTASSVRVSGADLIAQGVSSATSGNTYHEVVVKNKKESGDNLTVPGNEEYVKHYYINSGDGDALDLMTRFSEVKNYYAAGTTDADPNLL